MSGIITNKSFLSKKRQPEQKLTELEKDENKRGRKGKSKKGSSIPGSLTSAQTARIAKKEYKANVVKALAEAINENDSLRNKNEIYLREIQNLKLEIEDMESVIKELVEYYDVKYLQ